MTDLEQCAQRVGTTLRDKWKLERLIGVGGMAAVYVAAHKIGRRDAIKILHAEIASSPEVRARFEQEALAVNRFKHPGAVEVRDIDVTEDGAPFLVMELLEGDTLSRIVRREPGPSIDDVLRWADELLDVLAAAHAQGIVHRDIKPDNLFVTKEGRLKVLDFGIARLRSGAMKGMKTATGATLGTVSYMPPEQAKGEDIDGRADLFAVGATMFRLLAKRRVHEADNDFELLKKMATMPAPPLASVAPSLPEGVCRIVDRALQFERDRRYADASAMQAEVRAVRGDAAPVVAPASLPASAPSPLAASVEVPPALEPPESSTQAPTVGARRASNEPGPRAAVASSLPTRPDTTLRSGSPPALDAAQAIVTVPMSPLPPGVGAIATPSSPPLPASSPPAPPASSPPAAPASSHAPSRDRTKLFLIAGGAVLVLVAIVAVVAVAATVWLVNGSTSQAEDAATDAAPAPDAPADDPTASAAPSASAPSATHKPSAAPKPTAPPAPTHPPHPPHK